VTLFWAGCDLAKCLLADCQHLPTLVVDIFDDLSVTICLPVKAMNTIEIDKCRYEGKDFKLEKKLILWKKNQNSHGWRFTRMTQGFLSFPLLSFLLEGKGMQKYEFVILFGILNFFFFIFHVKITKRDFWYFSQTINVNHW
jgi:hypothetical protein